MSSTGLVSSASLSVCCTPPASPAKSGTSGAVAIVEISGPIRVASTPAARARMNLMNRTAGLGSARRDLVGDERVVRQANRSQR
jgi:hypothetical protein